MAKQSTKWYLIFEEGLVKAIYLRSDSDLKVLEFINISAGLFVATLDIAQIMFVGSQEWIESLLNSGVCEDGR